MQLEVMAWARGVTGVKKSFRFPWHVKVFGKYKVFVLAVGCFWDAQLFNCF